MKCTEWLVMYRGFACHGRRGFGLGWRPMRQEAMDRVRSGKSMTARRSWRRAWSDAVGAWLMSDGRTSFRW